MDGTNLISLGIDDGSTIFLVERVENVQVNVVPATGSNGVVESPRMEVIPLDDESTSVESALMYQPMAVSSENDMDLEYDLTRESRIQSTVNLVYWVRLYCVFGFCGSSIVLPFFLGGLIPLICYGLGYIGCRKLNRCFLVFPLLLSIIIGPIAFIFVFLLMVTHFQPVLVLILIISCLHVMVMTSILKLSCRVKRLSPEEKEEAIKRSNANRTCWCC